MLRIATTGTGARGLQVVDDEGRVKEVGDETDDDVLDMIMGREPGYYTEDWVFVRSLDSEPVAFGRGGQRAHPEARDALRKRSKHLRLRRRSVSY